MASRKEHFAETGEHFDCESRWLVKTCMSVLFTKQGGEALSRRVQIRGQNTLMNWVPVILVQYSTERICLRHGKLKSTGCEEILAEVRGVCYYS